MTYWVSVRNGAPHVFGFVNGTKRKIVPDTGAEISIVPGCLVYGDQLTGEQVDVKGWNGIRDSYCRFHVQRQNL